MVLPKLRAGEFQGLTDFIVFCSFMSPNSWFYCSSRVEVVRVGTHSHLSIAIVVPSPNCLQLHVDTWEVVAYFWRAVTWVHREVWFVDAFGRVGPFTQYVAGSLHIDCWTQRLPLPSDGRFAVTFSSVSSSILACVRDVFILSLKRCFSLPRSLLMLARSPNTILWVERVASWTHDSPSGDDVEGC